MKRNLNKILMLSVKSFYQERQEYATIGEIATTHYPLYLLWGVLWNPRNINGHNEKDICKCENDYPSW